MAIKTRLSDAQQYIQAGDATIDGVAIILVEVLREILPHSDNRYHNLDRPDYALFLNLMNAADGILWELRNEFQEIAEGKSKLSNKNRNEKVAYGLIAGYLNASHKAGALLKENGLTGQVFANKDFAVFHKVVSAICQILEGHEMAVLSDLPQMNNRFGID